MKTVIEVKNISKFYYLGEYGFVSFFKEIKQIFSKILLKNKEFSLNSFYALKDISFEINEGDIVGIIGHNGAGKSTLLKILSRITLPSKGEAKIQGKVSSLLEVGTGFHPEMTGRENIYLSGSLFGLKKQEIDKFFDSIIEFADIHDFVDTPVKRYSSGMFVRLAFSVAAHLEPDILIIDEVLAVGDADFQRKCIQKIDSQTKCGRTVLIVSHNLSLVASLCNKVILLDKGKIVRYGNTDQCISDYLNLSKTSINPSDDSSNYVQNLTVNGKSANQDNMILNIKDEFTLGFELQNLPNNEILPVLSFFTENGQMVFHAIPPNYNFKIYKNCHVSLSLPGNFFNNLIYSVRLRIHVKNEKIGWNKDNILYENNCAYLFTIVDDVNKNKNRHGKIDSINGQLRPVLQWNSIESQQK